MYIFCFLTDVAITNSFILYKKFSTSPKMKSVKEFRLKLAKQLIGNYSSRKLPGRCYREKEVGASAANPKGQTLHGIVTNARSGFVTMVILLLTAFWPGTNVSSNAAHGYPCPPQSTQHLCIYTVSSPFIVSAHTFPCYLPSRVDSF